MTFHEALKAAQQATKETIGTVQQTLFGVMGDFGEAEIEQILNALKEATSTSVGALRKDWKAFLKANGMLPDRVSKQSTGDILISLALDLGIELWHDLEGIAWATVPVNDHWEHHSLKAKSMKQFLGKLFFDSEHKAASTQAIQDALNALEAQAVFEGQEHPTFLRLAQREDKIFIDLCNANWEVVEVTSSGWMVRSNKEIPVRFRRVNGLVALPTPIKGGSLNDLAPLLNLETHSSAWKLLVAWLVGTLQGVNCPFAVLVLTGPQGSGKSTAARMLKKLVDPNVALVRKLPSEERDLMIMAVNGHVLAFDNLSGLSPAISDSLCRLSTGGAVTARQLYSDKDETFLHAMRPVILNGIDDFVKRQDLVSRSILVNLPSIPETNRKTETELWNHFELIWPGVLGALLDSTCYALGHIGTTHLASKPRLADFAVWVTAAEPVLGWKPGEFMEIYGYAQRTLISNALEVEPIAEHVIRLAESHGTTGWEGTSSEMLKLLGQMAGIVDGKRVPENWPKSPEKLSATLSRLVPALRSEGVNLERLPRTKYERLWKVANQEKQPSPPSSTPMPSDANAVMDVKPKDKEQSDGLVLIKPTAVHDVPDGTESLLVTSKLPLQPSFEDLLNEGSGDGVDSGDGFITTIDSSHEEVRWHDVD